MARLADGAVRFASDGWRPRRPAPAFDIAAHEPAVIEAVAAGFGRLLGTERASVAIAARIASDLALAGAPATLLGVAARVVEDEVRHVGVCTTVLAALGRPSDEPCAWKPPASVAADDARPTTLARLLVVSFIVGETLSEAIFARTLGVVREPLIRWAVTEVLRDETRHWALGADAAAWVMHDWRESERRALWPECVAMIEGIESRAGGPVTDALLARESLRTDWGELGRYGVLRPSEVCAAIVDSVAGSLIPRLTDLGIPQPV